MTAVQFITGVVYLSPPGGVCEGPRYINILGYKGGDNTPLGGEVTKGDD